MFIANSSIASVKRYAAIGSPCRTPRFILKYAVVVPLLIRDGSIIPTGGGLVISWGGGQRFCTKILGWVKRFCTKILGGVADLVGDSTPSKLCKSA